MTKEQFDLIMKSIWLLNTKLDDIKEKLDDLHMVQKTMVETTGRLEAKP